MSKSNTFVTGDSVEQTKQTYIIQPCALCSANFDFLLKGRTIQCGCCGAWVKEDPAHKRKLIRVG